MNLSKRHLSRSREKRWVDDMKTGKLYCSEGNVKGNENKILNKQCDNKVMTMKKNPKNNSEPWYWKGFNHAIGGSFSTGSPKIVYAWNTFQGTIRKYNEDRISVKINVNDKVEEDDNNKNNKDALIIQAEEAAENKGVDNTRAGNAGKCGHNIHYFAVFDGHGGTKCAQFLKDNLFDILISNKYFPHKPIKAWKASFQEAETQFLEMNKLLNLIDNYDTSGSCAWVILWIDEWCYCVNVGDSRAIYSANASRVIRQLNAEHKPNNEKDRINKSGGSIYRQTPYNSFWYNINQIPWRINPGKLSVSRAFGDIYAKVPELGGNPNVWIAKPEITVFELHSKSDFIFWGCDGIFDVWSNNEIAKCVWEELGATDDCIEKQDCKRKAKDICDRVMKLAMKKNSTDNVSCVWIGFGNMFHVHNSLIKRKKGENKVENPIDYIDEINGDNMIESWYKINKSECGKGMGNGTGEKSSIYCIGTIKGAHTKQGDDNRKGLQISKSNPKLTAYENYKLQNRVSESRD